MPTQFLSKPTRATLEAASERQEPRSSRPRRARVYELEFAIRALAFDRQLERAIEAAASGWVVEKLRD